MSERRTGIPKTTRLDTGQGSGASAPDHSTHENEIERRPAPAPSPSASASLELTLKDDIGKKIAGRYEITDVIGEGGMGVVYEAWDTQVERKVAIKLVRSDTTDRKFLSRFRRELEITSKLRHPSTIRVYEHGETRDGRPYMVMELLTGQSLADKLEQGPIEELEALRIARQVAESLSEAHEHGVFHRDLKPDNIFIETVGVSKVVKVLDFGIAGGVDATRLTQAGEVFGTPQYMSPEQCNGLPLDHRTDIYSLACILYEMLEGRPPFTAETPMATMLKHVRAKVPPPRGCNRETAKVVFMGLRKDRTKRIQTAGRFSELITQCIAHIRTQQVGQTTDRSASLGPQLGAGSGSVPALHHAGPAMPNGATPTPLPTGDAPPYATHDRWQRFIAVIAIIATLGLFIVLLFGGFTGSGESQSTAPAATVPSEARESPKLPFNRALVNSNADPVTVWVDGQEQCTTPCEIKVPVGDEQAHEIRLRKPGYEDVVYRWRPSSVTEPLPRLPDLVPAP